MKVLSSFVFLCVSTAWTQSALPAGEKGDTVIATFADDGGHLTLDEWKGLLQVHPSWQSLPREDAIQEYAFLRKAASVAQSKKLNDHTPYKEQLDFQILYAMAQIWAQDAASGITVSAGDVEKFYNDNKDTYKLVKASGILVAVGKRAPEGGDAKPALASKPVKKDLTEDEAKAKAEKLLAQIKGGADFGKVVLLESDDVASRDKGGVIGTFAITDNVPDDLRTAIFGSGKPTADGDVVGPLHQSNGYWVLHIDSVTYKPFADVRDGIFDQLRDAKVKQVLHDFKVGTKVQFVKQNDPAAPSEPRK
jgi:hypothetical protein